MAGMLDDVLGYTTPGGVRRRKQTEYQTDLTNSQTEKSLELQKKNMQANAIPTLMAYAKDQEKKAGWQSARSLWNAYSGGAPEARRQPSETDLMIQGLMKSLVADSTVSTPTAPKTGALSSLSSALRFGIGDK